MSTPRRASIPESNPAVPVPDSVAVQAEARSLDLSHVPAEHRDIVRRLHARVERAATSIERLRAENERLKARVKELETRPAVPPEKMILTLDDDPDAVRDRITSFIDAIDAYLDAAPSDASDEALLSADETAP